MSGNSVLRYLDLCINTPEDLKNLRPIIEKIEKCCQAIESKINLADILNEPQNLESVMNVFGNNNLVTGLQLILKIALSDYVTYSFNTNMRIEGEKKFEALYRARVLFEQFDGIISAQIPDESGYSINLINPQNHKHWKQLECLPSGTIIAIYLKTKYGERDKAQELAAGKVLKVLFETMQYAPNEEGLEDGNVVCMNDYKKKKTTKPCTGTKTVSFKKVVNNCAIKAGEQPITSMRITVNKLDVVVHAGNAHYILECLKGYSGRVCMSVLRAEKERVLLNADSIWAKEMRNGETVLFEFYDICPDNDFLKELAKAVNMYTQMDKVVNQ